MSGKASPSNIAFEVVIDSRKRTKTPSYVEAKRHERTLSRDDVDRKLLTAVERKKALEKEKTSKLQQHVVHVKGVAQKVKDGQSAASQQALNHLTSKLTSAVKQKSERDSKLKQNLADHSTLVRSRQEANQVECLTPGANELAKKLDSAEARRHAINEEKKGRLSQHLDLVNSRRSHENLPQLGDVQGLKIQNKLAAAAQRRLEQEKSLLQRGAERESYARDVRKRKATAGATC